MGALNRHESESDSADGDTIEFKRSPPATDLTDDLNSARVNAIKEEATSSTSSSPSLAATKIQASRSSSQSTTKSKLASDTITLKKEPVDTNGHISPKMEPEPPVKQSRGTQQKGVPRVAPLFDRLPDALDEAKTSFIVMDSCTYANKFLGYTEHAMECDCAEEWDGVAKHNRACGEDSDCINRATKMECVGDCACGSGCQNQRFQQKQYADVSVIKTEKKGYGLRTNTELRSGDFIFEYIGEVINEPQFRRRMLHYDEAGIKHFYFMSLSKGEFVDATKKGNLGRFCNHSCNPNCYVDKWVVGDKLRMGIFAERTIKAGEELVFNYNVDRYGANPQPCYCGESNCTGFIGGKTQTERATKLSAATIEALGIDDADGWDTTVARRPKKKKSEDDEDYVDSIEAKDLEADGVTKVMAALMQCKEKWIAVKLLQRIQRCNDESVRNRVVKMHGYQILNSQLAAWKEDENVVLQILDILDKFPRLTRNKIVDSKIEFTLKPFKDSSDERVSSQATHLLDDWSKLEVAYRIPRMKRDPNETATPTKTEPVRFERRESAKERRRSKSRSRSPPRGPAAVAAPSGPRSSLPQRNNAFFNRGPPPFNRPFNALPRGWFQAQDKSGRTYFYSANGQTTWARPTQPAEQPPPPPKQPSQQDVLKSIIDNIVTAKEKEREAKNTTPDTPKDPKKGKKEKKEDKWKSYDEDKRKKLYENTLFPHISHIMNRYKSKIPRDDLKRFAKDVAKKLVNSDFKVGRVKDPTKIDEKHQQKVKKYCKEFFDKAAHKHKKHEEEKARRKGGSSSRTATAMSSSVQTPVEQSPGLNGVEESPDVGLKKEEGDEEIEDDDEDVKMSEDESDTEPFSQPPPKQSQSQSPLPNDDDQPTRLKRKRSSSSPFDTTKPEDDDDLDKSPTKKLNLNLDTDSPPPPPPPPAPPAETPPELMTPAESTDGHSHSHSILHADTSFHGKSMADVLAEAQLDEGDGDGEMEMDTEIDLDGEGEGNTSMMEANLRFGEGVAAGLNGNGAGTDGSRGIEVEQQ